jgi:transposase-like protein
MRKVTWMKEGLLNGGTPEASEGERSEPKGAAGVPGTPDPEVPQKATRRKFSAEYKLRILRLADSCTDPGSLGRLLRKEGLYSSNLTTWRRQRDQGMLKGLEPAKRGRKATETNPLLPELTRLRKENEGLHKRLKRAELIIEVQKKVSQMLGLDPPEGNQKS